MMHAVIFRDGVFEGFMEKAAHEKPGVE